MAEAYLHSGEKKPRLVILAGPTAVGKTSLSLALAKAIGGEIISADSMQVYKHMDIGSAKIRPDEREGIPHFMIDELEPSEAFNVLFFQQRAKEYMKGIYERGNIPILVGGTGFYIQAVLYDIDFTQNRDDQGIRKQLEKEAVEKGPLYLYERLQTVDPASCEVIHANNVKRLIRALEYYELTGEPISRHNEEQRRKESPYDFSFFVLTDERQKLYQQIDLRVEKMAAAGLVEEVAALKEMGYDRSFVSMQGIGYKEMLDHLEGKISLEEALYQIKQNTRHFAKRQITWFKREKEVVWVNKPDFDYDNKMILSYMMEKMKHT
ncbi:MAG: tRNA (adenosine(37)-N6)-dimethylallyltransferase MiaA [Lachnospiraceae bacterium]|nr:tRNA (adenosine(37)-N6)-dimethylallyltransferase MiaA [Lachnospiraceae bacterium]